MTDLEKTLLQYQYEFPEVIEGIRNSENLVKMDFSQDNKGLLAVALEDTAAFSIWVKNQLKGKIGWGGYMEHREIYRRSRHFDDQNEPRSLHLGIDLWTDAGTAVRCPINGVVHSYHDNEGLGNYGPTLILEHQLESLKFYSLYGHLSRSSLLLHTVGDQLAPGQLVGWLGNEEENGQWPPHLHFQLIIDLKGWNGDFPGVAKISEKENYLNNCPDPNHVLRCGG